MMATRDRPVRRIVDELELDGIVAVGNYVAHGAEKELSLRVPKISADNSDLSGETEFSCYWDTESGALIYVPDENT